MASKNDRQDQNQKTEKPVTNNDPNQPRQVSPYWFMLFLGILLLIVFASMLLHKNC
jgi:hypothetical protein